MKRKRQAGFSTLELMIVIVMSLVISAIAIPEYLAGAKYLRIAGDLRDINGTTAEAKLRAAASFTHARIYADLTDNTFQLQVWNKAAGCWVADEDNTGTCLSFANAPAPSGPGNFQLSQGDTFGFGSLTSGPTAGQSTISQAAGCYPGSAAGPDGGTQLSNTACIEFNSRGIPVDNSNTPTPNGALYITNGNIVEAVTATATGSIQTWQCPHGQTTWAAQ
jgi:Tfp pilus assembly protein FimT